MGTQPSQRQPALVSYHIDLERRVVADHRLRGVAAVLDLSFVLPTVRHLYGRSGNVSLDPRVILIEYPGTNCHLPSRGDRQQDMIL